MYLYIIKTYYTTAMKKFHLVLLMLTCFIFQSYGQNNPYQRKVERFGHMQSMGYTMLGVGGGFATTGLVILVKYSLTSDDDNDDFGEVIDDVAQYTTGVIFLGVGLGLVAGGVTMSSIANHKIKIYKGKTSELSMSMNVDPDVLGLRMVYRF
jgi:hypothetical protein